MLWFGSDEGAKVMLNRETVLYEHRHDLTGADASRVRVKLRKGRNVLLVKVEELRYLLGLPRAADGSVGESAAAAGLDPAGEVRPERSGARVDSGRRYAASR